MNIYELPIEVHETMKIHDQCFDENGEMVVPQEVYDGIVQELEKLQNKQDDIVHWALVKRANAEANITALENEAKRLLDRGAREAKTVIHMEKLIAHFLPDLDKKVTIGNWDISYTKSEGTIILDPIKLPEELQVKTLVPKFDMMEYQNMFDVLEKEYEITVKEIGKKEVKAYIETLEERLDNIHEFIKEYILFKEEETPEDIKRLYAEREEIKNTLSNAYIERRKKLKIK